MLRRLRSLVRNVLFRGRIERDLDDELEAYVAALTEEKIAAGISPAAARRAARLEVGGIEQVKEEVRAARAGALLDSLAKDAAYAARALRRSPGFTASVVVTLALGIGVNTAIFGIVNALLLEPLPVVRDPDRLAWLRASSSYPDFIAYRDETDAFAGMTALGGTTDFSLVTGGRAELVKGELVTAGYFAVLGVDAAQGRTFVSEDDAPGAHPVVVISHRLWQGRFGGDPAIVGKPLVLNGLAFTVIGVTPREFIGAELGLPRDLFVPLSHRDPLLATTGSGGSRLEDPSFRWLNVIVRLRPGVSRAAAESVLAAVAARRAEGEDEETRRHLMRSVSLVPVAGGLDPRERGGAVAIAAFLLVVVGLVLLVACANVGGLLLARASSRAKEIGIRRALGASRARIVRQLMTESLLLAMAAGAAALLLASFTHDLLQHLVRATPITLPEIGLDANVLGFTLALAVVTAFLFGLAPALRTSRADMLTALKHDGVGLLPGASRSRLRRGLVVAQVALSFLLLIGAGLFTRSLQRAHAIDPGFEVERGLIVDVNPGMLRVSPERGQELYRQVVERVAALPGVERASLTLRVPFGLSWGRTVVYAEGAGDAGAMLAGTNVVGPGYFATLGIPLVRGRELEDHPGSSHAVVVNETLARRLFPGEDPLGKRIGLGDPDAPNVIVGVAADAKYDTLGESATPFVYEPLAQRYQGGMTLLVRTAGDPRASIDAVRERIRSVDRDLPISEITTLARQLDFALVPARAGAALLGGFGVLALVLTLVGIYGLVAYSVRQRTHEIGIRTALGARRRDVLALLYREGVGLVIWGCAIGLALALTLSRLAGSVFYGITPHDPLTYLAVSLLFAAVVALAIFLPARRALAVDPMIALRNE